MESLWSRIVAVMSSCKDGVPIDIAYLNSDLREARRIDLENGVRVVARNEEHVGDKTIVDFAKASDAFPPMTKDALFVEFSAEASLYMGDNAETFGLQIVNWDICKDSQVIPSVTKGLKLPGGLEEIFGMLWYIERGSELVVAPIGAIVGLDTRGTVAFREHFWAGESQFGAFRFSWSRARAQMAWYIYLIFSCFARINSGQFRLARTGSKSWKIE